MFRRLMLSLFLSASSSMKLKSPKTAHGPEHASRTADSSSRNNSLALSSYGPYTTVSHQGSVLATLTRTVIEKQPTCTSERRTSGPLAATRIPPEVPAAGRYAWSTKFIPNMESTSIRGTVSNFVSTIQTTCGLSSRTNVRTLSRRAQAFSPRVFQHKMVVLSMGGTTRAWPPPKRGWRASP